jgi:hypothetical protein
MVAVNIRFLAAAKQSADTGRGKRGCYGMRLAPVLNQSVTWFANCQAWPSNGATKQRNADHILPAGAITQISTEDLKQ